MLVIYTAGKYTGDDEWETETNIRKAEEQAQKIWENGMVAICPHKNTKGWNGFLSHKEFLDGDFEIIKRCDAVLMVPGWEESVGAVQEMKFAKRNFVPVFYRIEDIVQSERKLMDKTRKEKILDVSRAIERVRKESAPKKTILDEAKELVYGDREKDYGHPITDFTTTAKIWSAILTNKLTKDIDARDVALCMIGVKLSRESRQSKRDNIRDIAGYAETLDRVMNAIKKAP